MFRTNTGVIETGRDRMCVECLARLFLDHIRQGTLQNTRSSLGEGTAMFTILVKTVTSGFHTMQLHRFVIVKGSKGTNGVGSSTDTGNDCVGEFASLFQHLLTHFTSHDTLKVLDNGGKGMRTNGGSNQVVRVANIGYPITHGFVDGVLESRLAIMDGDNLSTQGVHTENIQLLTFAVNGSHVHGAIQTELGTNSGGSDTVLSGTGFGNDTRLTNTLGQQGLSNRVVNLVSAGVGQVLALQPNGGTTGQFRQTVGLVQRGGSADKVTTVFSQFCQKVGIVLDFIVLLFNFFESHRKCFGNVLSAVFTKLAHLGRFGPFLGHLSQAGSLIDSIRRLFEPLRQVRHDVADRFRLGGSVGIRAHFIHGF
mmetsp:Transcript_11920/g.22798  ORF Transcript_11920/g.22798 Transcript_11920/m.22798 type:complete len:366 (+) Transcript_11920:367-1464(+)